MERRWACCACQCPQSLSYSALGSTPFLSFWWGSVIRFFKNVMGIVSSKDIATVQVSFLIQSAFYPNFQFQFTLNFHFKLAKSFVTGSWCWQIHACEVGSSSIWSIRKSTRFCFLLLLISIPLVPSTVFYQCFRVSIFLMRSNQMSIVPYVEWAAGNMRLVYWAPHDFSVG